MTKAVRILLKRYENARRKYHNNWKLAPMEDLRAALKDLQKLASSIPGFGKDPNNKRLKRQISAIWTNLLFTLGGMLFGKFLPSGSSTNIRHLERELDLLTQENLVFREAQIKINNELSRDIHDEITVISKDRLVARALSERKRNS